jgi:hypothetical protein
VKAIAPILNQISLGVAVSLFLCGTLVSGLGQKVSRDWARYPAVAKTESSEDIFVVGDVHGDYERLLRVLNAAHIIEGKPSEPKDVVWTAGKAVLVFTGDLIDKGKHGIEVVALVRAMGESAEQKNGQVFVLMGNHEAEFLADPSQKKVRDFVHELANARLPVADIAACHGDLGSFLCSLPFAVRVRNWFFSHAGNTQGRSMAGLAADLQAGVNGDGFGSRELVGDNSILEARLGENGPNSAPWFDSGLPKLDEKHLLEAYVAALGVKHLVQGHQPGEVSFADGVHRKKGQVFQRYGLIFLVDAGMSEGVGYSQGAILHIKSENGEQATVICPDGNLSKIWDSKSVPDVGRARACGK